MQQAVQTFSYVGSICFNFLRRCLISVTEHKFSFSKCSEMSLTVFPINVQNLNFRIIIICCNNMNICRRSVDIKPGELRSNFGKAYTRSSFGTFEDVENSCSALHPQRHSRWYRRTRALAASGVPYSGGVRHCPQQSLKILTFLLSRMAMAMAMPAVRGEHKQQKTNNNYNNK